MTKALNEPVYEIRKGSRLYQSVLAEKTIKNNVGKRINETEKKLELSFQSLAVYSSTEFGISFNFVNEFSEKYSRELLRKDSDSNGVYLFKKKTPMYKEISEMLTDPENKELKQSVNRFATHDLFGMNNVNAHQWIGERLLFSVKDDDYFQRNIKSGRSESSYEEEKPTLVPYGDYLLLLADALREQEEDKK